MQKDSSGFPSYHPLPEFMKRKQNALEMQRADNASGMLGADNASGMLDADKHSGNQAANNSPRNYSGTKAKRALFHDYCAPGYYLITATALPESPRFSEISIDKYPNLKKGEMIIPDHTPLGEAIKHEILDIPAYHPEMSILRFVVMPDHIHFVLEVKKLLKRKLGSELAGFFGACSKASSKLQALDEVETLFTPFFERIIFSKEQLDRAIKYVEDNPRRYIIKKRTPELFKRYLHLDIAGHEYAAFGNIFLLRELYLLPVRVHRRWSEEEFRTYAAYCQEEIDKRAVPITPGIHPAEKSILEYAKQNGGRMIILKDKGFEDRFKPSGRDFDLCAEGRLLLLAPWPENIGRKSAAGYTEFHQMNDLALEIATLPATTRLSVIAQ